MNRSVSLSRGSAGQSAEASAVSSCHQKSRPGRIATGAPVRRRTTHFSTLGERASAASAFSFNGSCLPRRQAESAVIRSFAPASLLRSATASAENPLATTEWTAPMRAQANMAIANSGTSGM